MNLIAPTIGVNSGLTWETAINANSSIIDGHNHSPGSGALIQPNGMNINSSLTFNNFPATNLQACTFTAQISLVTLLSVYCIGNDLYYNDGAGNVIQITSGGAVNATSSGISSGTATASFTGGVLIVNAASNTPANIQGGSILLGNNSSGSKFLTLAPPAAMASNFGLTLPSVPGSQSFMSIDTSGNIAAYAAVSGGITGTMIAPTTVARSNLVAVGQQISSSCGTYNVTGSLATVTNLSVTITTSGRPVMVFTQSASSGVAEYTLNTTGSASLLMQAKILRGATTVYNTEFGASYSTSTSFWSLNGPFNLMQLDTPSAGTYTYTVQAAALSGNSAHQITNVVLVAYEL